MFGENALADVTQEWVPKTGEAFYPELYSVLTGALARRDIGLL